MRRLLILIVIGALSMGELALAQTQNSAQEKAATLRAQLADIETKQAGLQTRLHELDEALKPENIEQSLAGIGSTKPEDLREQRRKQLEIERSGVQKQIDLLTTSHTRLETALAQADAEAYRQSAAPAIATTTDTSPVAADSTAATTTPKRPRRTRKRKTRSHRPTTQQQISP
jgi:chromosome segregation ATPase